MSHPDLNQTLVRDRYFLRNAFRQPNRFGGIDKIQARYQKSHAAFLDRQAQLPQPSYDNTLPVHEKRDEIKAAIAANQVVILCGETGSGKTTQLPKICLGGCRHCSCFNSAIKFFKRNSLSQIIQIFFSI